MRLPIFLFMVFLAGACKDKVKNDTGSGEAYAGAKAFVGEAPQQIPVFDYAGLEPALATGDNKVHIVNFWATWCAPCVRELPHFERINEEYGGLQVEVTLVSLDMPQMWESRLVPFVREHRIRSRVVILDDPRQNTWIPLVNPEWSGAIPATLIFTRDKRSFYEASFSYEELKNQLQKFITL